MIQIGVMLSRILSRVVSGEQITQLRFNLAEILLPGGRDVQSNLVGSN